MRIAVLDNLKKNAPPAEPLVPDTWAELSKTEDVQPIVDVLQSAGHTAEFLEGGPTLVDLLPRFQPDLCFNMCEGHFGESRESQVPAILEMLRLPYTGAGVLALALTLDKVMTKRWLSFHGIPTPPFQVFTRADETLDPALHFPLFVKPAREGSGKGVTADSITENERQLRETVARITALYRQPALVERFIRGREVTVGLLGNPQQRLTVLPPLEIVFRDPGRGVYSHSIKSAPPDGWVAGKHYMCPAPLETGLQQHIERLAREAFVLTGCRDYARIDFRLDSEDNDQPYLLEVNALPGIFRDWSDMSLQAKAAGMSYEELILGIVGFAESRWKR